MAWTKANPSNNELLVNFPAQCRANWDALELGTDASLLITNAKIAAAAGIVDSKLAQITTAGKISGAAITLLPNIPAGAGEIPIVNLPTIVTAGKVSGAAITLLPNLPAGAGVIPTANLPSPVFSFAVVIDGGGTAITTGKKIRVVFDFACTLTQYTLVADVAGAIVIDINRSTYGDFPTTVSMPGAGKEPTIAATNQKSQDTNISDWTSVAVVAGNVLEFEVDSCTTITNCTVGLKYTRTLS